ncbi:MAG: hypothetical protein C0399_09635, partial [Syntrophus sp. (in: bacteria)]|nr:hypothetical protein [Syntrophus sp. (in: bacteria)]
KEEVYLKVITSDTADFAKPRVMPKPLVLAVEQVKIKDRGWADNLKHKIERETDKLDPGPKVPFSRHVPVPE